MCSVFCLFNCLLCVGPEQFQEVSYHFLSNLKLKQEVSRSIAVLKMEVGGLQVSFSNSVTSDSAMDDLRKTLLPNNYSCGWRQIFQFCLFSLKNGWLIKSRLCWNIMLLSNIWDRCISATLMNMNPISLPLFLQIIYTAYTNILMENRKLLLCTVHKRYFMLLHTVLPECSQIDSKQLLLFK